MPDSCCAAARGFPLTVVKSKRRVAWTPAGARLDDPPSTAYGSSLPRRLDPKDAQPWVDLGVARFGVALKSQKWVVASGDKDAVDGKVQDLAPGFHLTQGFVGFQTPGFRCSFAAAAAPHLQPWTS